MGDDGHVTTPEDIEATWDHDGLTAVLPGATLDRRDFLTTMALLGGGTDLLLAIMFGIAVATGRPVGLAEILVFAAFMVGMPLLYLPFYGLGYLRASGSPITVRIEPVGGLAYSWMGDGGVSDRVDIGSVIEATAPEEGPPRVELQVMGEAKPRVWRVRTREHAHWLAKNIEQARLSNTEREGSESAVPEELQALRRSLDASRQGALES